MPGRLTTLWSAGAAAADGRLAPPLAAAAAAGCFKVRCHCQSGHSTSPSGPVETADTKWPAQMADRPRSQHPSSHWVAAAEAVRTPATAIPPLPAAAPAAERPGAAAPQAAREQVGRATTAGPTPLRLGRRLAARS